MSVNSKLTAIADAIREKTGESGSLTLDAMAAAIAGIEAGGGNVTSGFFSLDANTAAYGYELTHGLGVIPKFFIVFLDFSSAKPSTKNEQVCTILIPRTNGTIATVAITHNSSSSYYHGDDSGSWKTSDLLTETTAKLVGGYSGNNLIAGKTYHWVAVGE